MPYKVGITGGIGCGKSTVTQVFSALDVPTFSADNIAHDLSGPDAEGYLKIIQAFGSDILHANGEINRTALGDIIFNDASQKKSLEAIMHPLIMHALHEQADKVQTPYCILDIPLLINTEERHRVNRVLVVNCDKATRVDRIKQRNRWSDEKIETVMNNQVSDEALHKAADDMIENNQTIDDLKRPVLKLHTHYLSLSRAWANKG